MDISALNMEQLNASRDMLLSYMETVDILSEYEEEIGRIERDGVVPPGTTNPAVADKFRSAWELTKTARDEIIRQVLSLETDLKLMVDFLVQGEDEVRALKQLMSKYPDESWGSRARVLIPEDRPEVATYAANVWPTLNWVFIPLPRH